jgi:hypothetical protein
VGKAVLVVALFAIIVYVAIRLVERRGAARSNRGLPPAPTRPRRSVAPDDDPEFLREIERRRRREQRERQDRDGQPGSPGEPDTP